ncbi:hypothetical protein CC86DRAFT_153033 [Ophiobolus disseminans]|uniref:Secreted protein n=1 Tax=Ophiobolus disseminans TaxID=1469910 RepID=A0A6A6ZCJ7_9PLEO|nr:hypothetical protein CC86DRAFT_153033 [Ophiobolus disseminans]
MFRLYVAAQVTLLALLVVPESFWPSLVDKVGENARTAGGSSLRWDRPTYQQRRRAHRGHKPVVRPPHECIDCMTGAMLPAHVKLAASIVPTNSITFPPVFTGITLKCPHRQCWHLCTR